MKGRVAIIVEGQRLVHAENDPAGTYASLCGLDGGFDDAESRDGQSIDKLKRGEKINCPQCKAIWTAARAYRITDFA